LVQLIDAESAPNDFLRMGDDRSYADLVEPRGLREIATYAQVLAPHKDLVVPRTADGCLGEPTRLVDHAHRAGLGVQVWTFRAERRFLPTATDFRTELTRFAALGLQGVFADHPDQAVTALRKPALNV
jgi:glycerophosphoryl diester phosphodiesterase